MHLSCRAALVIVLLLALAGPTGAQQTRTQVRTQVPVLRTFAVKGGNQTGGVKLQAYHGTSRSIPVLVQKGTVKSGNPKAQVVSGSRVKVRAGSNGTNSSRRPRQISGSSISLLHAALTGEGGAVVEDLSPGGRFGLPGASVQVRSEGPALPKEKAPARSELPHTLQGLGYALEVAEMTP